MCDYLWLMLNSFPRKHDFLAPVLSLDNNYSVIMHIKYSGVVSNIGMGVEG